MQPSSFFKLIVLVTIFRSIRADTERNPCWTIPERDRTWEFIPCEDSINNADPVARVFNGRLYVYTSWDDKDACGERWNKLSLKKQGTPDSFCMPGYRAYSTEVSDLKRGWHAHGPILREESVPWVSRGAKGWRAAARMWAIDVVEGDDGRYYMFFTAAKVDFDMRIGVAVADDAGGPFIPRIKDIGGRTEAASKGIDPSVIKLPSGKWVMFISRNGEIYVQNVNPQFDWVGKRKFVTGLKAGYKEGPHAVMRNGYLMLYYAVSVPSEGYSIRQARAFNPLYPDRGFWDANTAIAPFDGRTNHAFNVQYDGREWMFYHRHMERRGSKWSQRRIVFSPAAFNDRGIMRTIKPYYGPDFQVSLPN